jgi:hypothetical protein
VARIVERTERFRRYDPGMRTQVDECRTRVTAHPT